jgi:hypothetical protein
MAGVFQNIDLPASVYPPPLVRGGGHTRWLERGVGVNILKYDRYSFVLYVCRYSICGGGSPPIPRGVYRVNFDPDYF